jgi:phosphoglycolate phosphatase
LILDNGLNKIPDALIFDMDGTLWDAVGTYTLAWNRYFEEQGIGTRLLKKDLDNLMGLEEHAFLEKVLPEFTPDERAMRYKEVIQLQYDLIDHQGGIIYEGVLEYLPLLRRHFKLFIVSNCPKYTIRHFMKFAQIEPFICDSLSHGQNYRPKHENIRKLMQRHRLVSPVYIGDTESDRKQSEMADIPFVFMGYGFGSCEQAETSFDSFEEFAIHFLHLANKNN